MEFKNDYDFTATISGNDVKEIQMKVQKLQNSLILSIREED